MGRSKRAQSTMYDVREIEALLAQAGSEAGESKLPLCPAVIGSIEID